MQYEEEMVLEIAGWLILCDGSVTTYLIREEFPDAPTTVIERAVALAVNIERLWPSYRRGE